MKDHLLHSEHNFYKKSLLTQQNQETQLNKLEFNRVGKLTTSDKDDNGSSQVKLGSTGAAAVLADSTISPTADQEDRPGWNFTNTSASTKYNIYFFDGTNEILTLGQLSSIFTKVYINQFTTLQTAPFLQIYTKPTGTGDAGAFYHSRISYVINSDVHVGVGEQVILYGKNQPNTNCDNRLIELKTVNTDGDGEDSEEILYMVVASDSSAPINSINHTVSSMGFNTVDLGADKGIVNRDYKLVRSESSSDGATETTLTTLNDKITKGYDATISSGGDGLQQALVYGRDSQGNLDALNVDNNGHLKIAVDTVENKGTLGNVQNGTLTFGSSSSVVNVADYNYSNLIYEDTNASASESPIIEISIDNIAFTPINNQPFLNLAAGKRTTVHSFSLHGIKYLRIVNNGTTSADNFTNCVCSIVGTPN